MTVGQFKAGQSSTIKVSQRIADLIVIDLNHCVGVGLRYRNDNYAPIRWATVGGEVKVYCLCGAEFYMPEARIYRKDVPYVGTPVN